MTSFSLQRIIEISPMYPLVSHEAYRVRLMACDDERIRVLPPVAGTSWLLVGTRDLGIEEIAARLVDAPPCVVTELRCRLVLDDSHENDALRELLTGARRERRLVVGRAAVERALQRRQLDVVVLADDFDDAYGAILPRILDQHAAGIQIIASGLTATELAIFTDARRAGCVGVQSGFSVLILAGQTRRSRGRVVSSVPGSPSSAPP